MKIDDLYEPVIATNFLESMKVLVITVETFVDQIYVSQQEFENVDQT